jgi:hypothetical protein
MEECRKEGHALDNLSGYRAGLIFPAPGFFETGCAA